MPEREISHEQWRAVRKWIDGKSGEKVEKKADSIFMIEGEPFVVFLREHPVDIYDEFGDNPNNPVLVCSEKLAQELEEAGIVSFQEVKEESK